MEIKSKDTALAAAAIEKRWKNSFWKKKRLRQRFSLRRSGNDWEIWKEGIENWTMWNTLLKWSSHWEHLSSAIIFYFSSYFPIHSSANERKKEKNWTRNCISTLKCRNRRETKAENANISFRSLLLLRIGRQEIHGIHVRISVDVVSLCASFLPS